MTRQGLMGSFLAAIHLIVFFWFIYYLSELSGRDGQSQLLWIYWLVIDFPVSLIVILLFAVDVTSHYMLYFVHGILGTIWWFFVPTVLHNGFMRIKKTE